MSSASHGLNFFFGRGAVEAVHMVVAERSVADERSDVDRGAGLGKCGDVVGESWVTEVFALAKQVHWVGRIALEAHGRRADAAVADDDGGDALGYLGQHLRVFQSRWCRRGCARR